MKVIITDSRALSALLPSTVKRYLRMRGWTEVESDTAFALFRRPVDVDIVELEVPLRSSSGDYARRVAELFHNLELFEGRSQLDIYRDIHACSTATSSEC